MYMTTIMNGNSGTGKTIQWQYGIKQEVTLTGNCTLTFSAPPSHQTLTLVLRQDTTGGRTITWPSNVKWAGGTPPTLTSTANKKDIVSFFFDGTNYYGMATLNF